MNQDEQNNPNYDTDELVNAETEALNDLPVENDEQVKGGAGGGGSSGITFNHNETMAEDNVKAVKRILNVTENLGLFYDAANGHHSLRALQRLPLNAVLHTFSAREYVARPTYLSVQVADDRHIHLAPEFLQYINHSCEPNTFFDTQNGEVVALRDIAANEEITFFYSSTEWSMTQPFACFCGARSCLGQIQGALHLPKQALAKYRFAGHIQRQLVRLFGEYWKTTRELALNRGRAAVRAVFPQASF